MTRFTRWSNLRLRTKLTLLIEASILLLGVATGLVATMRVRSTLETELTRRGLAIAADVAMYSVRPLLENDLAALRRSVNHAMAQDHVRAVSVMRPDATVVMHSDLARLGTRALDPISRGASAAEGPGFAAMAPAGDGQPAYGIHYPITVAGARLGTVVMEYSRAAAETEIARARREIGVIWLGAMAAGGLLAFLLSSYITRPIATIAVAMRDAPDGEVRRVPELASRDEIGVLAASFNKMADDLSRHRQHLNELVDARTAELLQSNARLEAEIEERRRVEEQLRTSRQQLRDLASHLQSVREQERTDVAREIHDELGQALTALKMDIHQVTQRLGDAHQITPKLRAMSKAVDATVQAVRRISSELRPKLLDDLGLSAALEWQAREFEQRAGIACTIRSEPDDIVLDQARSTALFRIFQEALTNVARHAQASRVDVLLHALAGAVELNVADDGKGIAAGQVESGRSLGIVGMRERVRALGGQLDIGSRPEGGTRIHVVIPN